jgi:hypothetical protein
VSSRTSGCLAYLCSQCYHFSQSLIYAATHLVVGLAGASSVCCIRPWITAELTFECKPVFAGVCSVQWSGIFPNTCDSAISPVTCRAAYKYEALEPLFRVAQ